MTTPLCTTPERIAELRALADAPWTPENVASLQGGMRDVLDDRDTLTTENERLRAEVAAKDGEIREWRRRCERDITGGVRSRSELALLQQDIAAANARADTAEAALKAGHAGEVTDAMVDDFAAKLLDAWDHDLHPWEHAAWPEHKDDDGYRGGGYIKLQPHDVRARMREFATRVIAIVRATLAAGTRADGLRRAAETDLCEECPPSGYITDKPRCWSCPRRTEIGDAS